jgi:hypothetical protein
MPKTIKNFLFEILSSHPQLKSLLRVVYSRVAYCVAGPKTFFRISGGNLLPAEAVTGQNGHCFFGYYDRCPWGRTGHYLLYHQASFADRMPEPGEAATIGFIDLDSNNQPHILGQTTAWCWQQGCMLQWLEGNPDLLVIHNDFQNGRYVSLVRDLNGNIRKILPLPVYAITKDGKQAVSLNFGRLHYGHPGYGYVARPYPDLDKLHPSDDGIWHMDLETGRNKLIISLDQIAHHSPREDFKHSFHYFNHLTFNPSGTRFVFLHRWFLKKAGDIRGKEYTRMYTANPDGTDIYCIADYGMVSHYAWKNDRHLLVWATHPSYGNRYYVFEDKTESVNVTGNGILTVDGHPSYSPDSRWIITDTYPNRGRLATLILFDTLNSKRINIGSYKSPFKFNGPWRCDLHPRWSRDGKKVCFDSVHEGKRRIYVVDLSNLL